MTENRKKKTNILHTNPWWQYKCDTGYTNTGEKTSYYYGESNGNSLVIPISGEKIILIEQKRYLKNKKSLEFPSGWLETNETPLQAAKRELEEETCFKTKKIKKITTFEASAGAFKNTCHVYCAEQLSKIQNCDVKDSGIDKLYYCTKSEIDKLIKCGKIWNAQTIAAWMIYKLS